MLPHSGGNPSRKGLQSADPVIRAETLGVALRDDNQGIRIGAIGYDLRSKPTLSVSLVLPPGSSIDPGTIPTLDVATVEWDRDANSDLCDSQKVISYRSVLCCRRHRLDLSPPLTASVVTG